MDLVIFSQSGRRKKTVQVKGLNRRSPAPFGGSKETLIADYVVIFQHVLGPRAFVERASEVRRRLHKGVKEGVVS